MFINEANHIYITMLVYNLIKYSDNYSDTSGSWWDELAANNADLSIDNSKSFKYKAALVEKMANAVNNTNSSVKNTKTVVQLKYLSNFWRSLERPLINCKTHLELNWIEDSILSSDGDSTILKIIDAKLHISIVTLSTKDSVNLTKQLSNGFKISICWDSYQTILAKVAQKGKIIYELLSASIQGVKRLYVLACFIAAPVAPAVAYDTAGMKTI